MTTTTEPPICEARDVSVAYDAARSKFAIRDVSVAVYAGEIVAILGPSGCGKSTLLRTLIGLQEPTSGEVLADGRALAGVHPRVALVFQSFALYPWLTVRENIAVALEGLALDTFQAMVQRLRSVFVTEFLPEEAPAPATAPAPEAAKLEPLPGVTLGEVFGVMEILKQNAGEMDVFTLDEVTDYDFGRTLSVVKAGEMLELLDTPGNTVVLTETGRKLLASDTNARKDLINRQLRTLKTFQFVVQILGKAEEKKLPKEIVLEEFAMLLPSQEPEQLFETMVGVARYAELLGYEPQAEILYLDQPDAVSPAVGENMP